MTEPSHPLCVTTTPDPDVFEEWSAYVQRFESDEDFLRSQVAQNVLVTKLDRVVGIVDHIYNWSRRSSIWPLQFGLACCAIEMIAAAAGRFDIDRFGAGLFRPSPRQADLMIVSGTVTKKMAPQVVRLWNQMPQPRYCLAMGACATGGGPFKEGYSVVSGIDTLLPVDVYVPGCPPTPQALLHGLMTLQRKIDAQHIRDVSWYRSGQTDEVPVPMLGADLVDIRRLDEIRSRARADRGADAVADPVAGAVADAVADAVAGADAGADPEPDA
jgi:NADH-quinone oxidoreductase B subunit